jgi:hypothetical protein
MPLIWNESWSYFNAITMVAGCTKAWLATLRKTESELQPRRLPIWRIIVGGATATACFSFFIAA